MDWISWIGDPNAWISLVTLTSLEVVLGIDNVIFISILAGKLPPRPTRESSDHWPGIGIDHPAFTAAQHQMADGTDKTSGERLLAPF
jgi:hypothetical protein